MKIQRWVGWLLLFALAACAPVTRPDAPGPATPAAEIRLYHFNDFHGQVAPIPAKDGSETGGLSRLAGVWEAQGVRAGADGVPAALVFSGDAFTGTAFSTLFQGHPEFDAFAAMRLSAMTTGNHEWDFGQGILRERTVDAPFPLLLANVRAADPARVFWKPFVVLVIGGRRLGIIGVTAPDTPQTTAPGSTLGFEFTDPAEAVAQLLAAHRTSWDSVILLSHCGFEWDRKIAQRNPSLDLIVGGHDHKMMENRFQEGPVAIVQAGDRGRFLGEVVFRFPGGGRPELTSRLLPVTQDSPTSPTVEAQLAPWLEREEKALGASLATLPEALDGDRMRMRTSETALGNFVADALRKTTGARIAFVNGGAIRAGLPEGPVTGRDLYACVPFFDSACTVILTGQQIEALLARCAAMPTDDPPGGFLQVSGLSVTYAGGKAQEIRVAGAPLDPAADYTVGCTGFLTSGGDGLVEFAQGRDRRDFGVSLQEVARQALVAPDRKVPGIEGRITRKP